MPIQFLTSKDSTFKEVISWMNQNLGKSPINPIVFTLFEEIQQTICTEQFNENCSLWIIQFKRCLQTYKKEGRGSDVVLVGCCDILSNLLSRASDSAQLRREVATQHVTPILNLLMQLTNVIPTVVSARCYHSIISNYPTAIASQTVKQLQKLILTSLVDNDHTPPLLRQCQGMLWMCGPVATHPGQWLTTVHSLTTHIHHSLHQLTADTQLQIPISTENESTAGGIEFPELAVEEGGGSVSKYFSLSRRVANMCHCLGVMLSGGVKGVHSPTQHNLTIPTQQIFNVVRPLLTIDINTLSKYRDTDSSNLLLVLPQLQQSAVLIMEGLLLRLGSDILEYSGLMSRMYVQCLRWTMQFLQQCATNNSIVASPLSDLLEVLLAHMSTWLATTPGAEHTLIPQLPSLVQDVLITVISLASAHHTETPANSANQSRKGKKRKKGGAPTAASVNTLNTETDETVPMIKPSLRVAALKLLRMLVLKCANVMDSDTWKVILTGGVFAPLLSVQDATGVSSGHSNNRNWQQQYPDCRLHLYKLLHTCVIKCHMASSTGTVPNILSLAITIFTHGTHDSYIKIATFCEEALCVCNVIVSPAVAPRCPLPLLPTTSPTPIESTSNSATPTEIYEDQQTLEDDGSGKKVDRSTQTVRIDNQRVDSSLQPQVMEVDTADINSSSNIDKIVMRGGVGEFHNAGVAEDIPSCGGGNGMSNENSMESSDVDIAKNSCDINDSTNGSNTAVVSDLLNSNDNVGSVNGESRGATSRCMEDSSSKQQEQKHSSALAGMLATFINSDPDS